MENPKPHEIDELFKKKLIGFNNRKYDNHILYAAHLGYNNGQLYNLSSSIVNKKPDCYFGEAYNLSYTDIYDFCQRLALKDINKIYPNGVQAVYDFNIDIKEKDFIVLVGPSGCGKSTTLRMIAGLEDITSGYLYIDKVLSNYLPSKNRDISMVFQSYALYPQMTVYDNIAFPLRIRRYRRVMTAAKNLAWNEVLVQLQEPSKLIQALREAQDKSLNFGTVIEYVATKLNISDLASKLLCSSQYFCHFFSIIHMISHCNNICTIRHYLFIFFSS